MAYSVNLDPRAIEDIREIIDYYEEQEPGLGKRFEQELGRHILLLEENPFYQVRYDNVRCLPVKVFPHMLHFTIDNKQKQVTIWAVFHTAMDPQKWVKRKG